MDTFSLLDQRHRNYFYRLASQDGTKSGRQIYQETIPENLQDCPHESAAYLDGLPEAGIEARHSSHIISKDNGGSDTQDNRMMERESDNLGRGNDASGNEANMTSQEVATAEFNNQADADVIDAHFTHDEGGVLAVATDGAAESTDILGSVADVAVDVVLPFVYGAKFAHFMHSKIYDKSMTKRDSTVATITTGSVATAVLMSTVGAPSITGAVIWSVGRLAYRVGRKFI